MNYYKDLQRIDIGQAINKMAEVVLPCFTKEKIFTIHLVLELCDYRRVQTPFSRRRKEITFIYHRPDNYMFSGFIQGGALNLTKDSHIEFLSCHDSCWSDAVERKISEMASELSKGTEDEEGLSVYTNFGLFGTQIIIGNIKTKTTARKANFVPIN